jgi:hypothetical protein
VLRQHLGDRRRQSRLAMVNVTNRPNIHVRLCPLELLLRHISLPSVNLRRSYCLLRPPVLLLRNSPSIDFKAWSGGRDLNPQPSPWKSETLPLSYPRPVLQILSARFHIQPPLCCSKPGGPSARLWSLGPGLNR